MKSPDEDYAAHGYAKDGSSVKLL